MRFYFADACFPLHLWLSTVSSDGKLHPHGSQLALEGRRWAGEVSFRGGLSGESQEQCRIKLIAVSSAITERFGNYLRSAAHQGQYPGLNEIPHRILASTEVR